MLESIKLPDVEGFKKSGDDLLANRATPRPTGGGGRVPLGGLVLSEEGYIW